MESRTLHHIANVALSRGAPPNHRVENALTSPTALIVTDSIERLPEPQQVRHYPSMPHIDTFFKQNTESQDALPQSVAEQFSADLIKQFSAIFARIGLGIHQLAPQSTSLPPPQPNSQRAHFQTSQLTQQLQQSSPPILAISECKPRRNSRPIPQTSQDLGVDGVRFTLPATGQRTGANPNSSLLATTTSTSQLPPQKPEWDHDDRDLLLKSANRAHYTESSGIRIRAFVEDAENFMEMCGRPRVLWARFIISWLGPNETEKVRRSHFVADNVDYSAFCEGLFTLFGRLDFKDSYRQQLRVLAQSGAESVAEFASRTTDLSTCAYPNFPTDIQLDLAVDHFISGLHDASSRERLPTTRARSTPH